MKNIALVLTGMRSGGLERNASILSNHFADEGNNVFIFCLYSDECFFALNKNIKIINLATNKNKFLSILKWTKLLKNNFINYKIETVISFGERCGIITALANKNKINHICRGINTKKKSILHNAFLYVLNKRITSFVFQTKAQKNIFPKKIQRKGFLISNPFSIYKENINKDGLFSKSFVCVASFKINQKRQDIMIEAFKKFGAKYQDYSFHFYGRYTEKEFHFINNLLIQNNLTNKIFIHGEAKDIKDKIIPARAFICASQYEGMPNALIEALSFGIPVISSSWNGYDEILEDRMNSLIFKINDSDDLALKMEEIVSDDILFTKLSNNAYSHFLCQLDKKDILKKWDELI